MLTATICFKTAKAARAYLADNGFYHEKSWGGWTDGKKELTFGYTEHCRYHLSPLN